QVAAADLFANFQGLSGVIQEETRDVAGVDHLHDQADAGFFELGRGVAQVFHQGRLQLGEVGALGCDPRQAVDLSVAQHLGIGDGLVDAGAEFLDPLGIAGDATVTTRPVTGRQVEQHLGQAVGVQLRLDLLGRVVVGEEVLDPGEAGLGGSGETVHEVQLGKEHGEVGGKTWHLNLLVICRDQFGGCAVRHPLYGCCGVASGGYASRYPPYVGWKTAKRLPRVWLRLPQSSSATAVGASSRPSARGSNSLMASISVPMAMLVTRSRITSITTGTWCSAIQAWACSMAGRRSSCLNTRIALQPRPSTTATWSTP